MKIKLAYPKIPDSKDFLPKSCVAFEKIDGTNIHFVLTPHRPYEERPHYHSDSCCGDEGIFDFFGTRRSRFSYDSAGFAEFKAEHPGLEDALDRLSADIFDIEVFLHWNYVPKTRDEIIIFTEYHGPGSFAGQHVPHNYYDENGICCVPNKHRLTLIDVMVDGVILPPDLFIRDFNQFGIPKVVYEGKFSGQFVEDVRNGKFNVDEGVVCKGVVDGQVHMCKIKTNAYMERLKKRFKNNWKNYWE